MLQIFISKSLINHKKSDNDNDEHAITIINEPLYNEVLDITKGFAYPSDRKICEINLHV